MSDPQIGTKKITRGVWTGTMSGSADSTVLTVHPMWSRLRLGVLPKVLSNTCGS